MRLSTLARSAVAGAVLALAAPAASAQIVPQLDIGVAGGVNFANINDATSLDLGTSTGYHVGAYADFSFLVVSARTGLYYLWAGELGDAVGASTSGEGDDIRFLTVPVDFQLQTPTPFVQAYVLVGPEFRFPISDFEGLGATFDREDVNTIVNIGVGVSGGLPLFGPSGFAELRYGYDPTGFGTEGGDDAKLDLVLLRVGLGI